MNQPHRGRCGGHREKQHLRQFWVEMTEARGGEGRGSRGRGGYGGGYWRYGGFPGPRGRGRKARRGDIRTAALLLLAEEPRNGYQIMQEVEERSDGVWRPSPGSVYPALAQLEDEGLIAEREGERKLYELTDAGRAELERRGDDAPAPWEAMSDEVSDAAFQTRRLLPEVAIAFTQVLRSGSDEQLAAARKVMEAAKRDLYRILAGEQPQGEEPGEDS
jgi:DNA-binding PadR family transcriptional regulator